MNSHYFVVDCDNFIQAHTLEILLEADLPIVGPLLRNDDFNSYANYHAEVDQNGYLASSPFYSPILSRTIRGLIEVPELIDSRYERLVTKEFLSSKISKT